MGEENTNVSDAELEAALAGDNALDGDGGDDGHAGADGGNSGSDNQDGDGGDGGGEGDGTIDWEKELHKTKSDFGRKQKKLENQISELTQNMQTMLEVLKAGGGQQKYQQQGDAFDEDEPIPLTMGGLAQVMESLLNQKNSTVTQEQKKYENAYLKTVENLGSEYSDKVHKIIVDRMFKDFNIKRSNNPALDAELNFRNAEASILREIRLRKANPLDKNKGKKIPNLGGSNNTDQDNQDIVPVKLDPYAADFIKSTGMSEEDATKALQGDMPMYLRGKATI